MSFVERQRISRYQQTRLHYSCNRNKKAPISTGWVQGQTLTTAVCKRRDVTSAWNVCCVDVFVFTKCCGIWENRGIREVRLLDVSTDDQWPYTETFVLCRECWVSWLECDQDRASLISTERAHGSELRKGSDVLRSSGDWGEPCPALTGGEALSVPAALCHQGQIFSLLPSKRSYKVWQN